MTLNEGTKTTTITVEVRLGAALREYLAMTDTKPFPAQVPASANLPALYRALGLDPEQVAFSTINNRYPEDGYTFQDGDRLRIVAHVVGG